MERGWVPKDGNRLLMIKKVLLISCLFAVFPIKAQAQSDLDVYLSYDVRAYSATLETVIRDLSRWLFKKKICAPFEKVVVRVEGRVDFSVNGCYLIYGVEDSVHLNPWLVSALIIEKGEKRRLTYHFRLLDNRHFSQSEFAYLGYEADNLEMSQYEIERLFVEIFR